MQLAGRAEANGEVPVGAVVVKGGQIVGEGFNGCIGLHDPSAHAEMLALRQAGQQLQNYRLVDCTLYVTLEPCAMCAGLLVHSRVQRLVYGAADAKAGACGSVFDLVRHPQLNHQLEVTGGVLAAQCSEQLSAFFRRRRAEQKAQKQKDQSAASAVGTESPSSC